MRNNRQVQGVALARHAIQEPQARVRAEDETRLATACFGGPQRREHEEQPCFQSQGVQPHAERVQFQNVEEQQHGHQRTVQAHHTQQHVLACPGPEGRQLVVRVFPLHTQRKARGTGVVELHAFEDARKVRSL